MNIHNDDDWYDHPRHRDGDDLSPSRGILLGVALGLPLIFIICFMLGVWL